MKLTVIKNGYPVDLDDYNLQCLSFQVDSLEPEHTYESIQGKDGQVHNGTTIGSRLIHTRFLFQVDRYEQFHDKKDDVYTLFNPKDELILIDERQPHKQWTARAESFVIDNAEMATWKEFELDFLSTSPYAEATEATVTTSTSNNFIVYNNSSIRIDPREYDLQITFTGESDKLRIVNNLNGTQWQYNGTTASSDTIKLDSVYSYKNDESIFKDTNYSCIELEKGSNEIQIYGATGDFQITFEFIPLHI
jgi:hypothetical protein